MIPVIIVIGLVGVAAWRKTSKKKMLTPNQESLFKSALEKPMPSDSYLRLADAFEKEGFKAEAELLRKRATLRDLPPEVKAQRREVISKAMQSDKPEVVYKIADAFEAQGATGTAADLRRYAEGVKDAAVNGEHMRIAVKQYAKQAPRQTPRGGGVRRTGRAWHDPNQRPVVAAPVNQQSAEAPSVSTEPPVQEHAPEAPEAAAEPAQEESPPPSDDDNQEE